MSAVAVLDVGKTNVKLSAVTRQGVILETLSTPNSAEPGPPYRHPDLAAIEAWALAALGPLARRHGVTAIVATCHGSAGVLVGEAEPLMPMIDYEDEPPAELNAAYAALAGPIEERGSPIMGGAAHLARQMLWIETAWPAAFQEAHWFLGGPQYWAWRLSGVAASELTYLGAQSHLWNIPGRRFAAIVEARGWQELLPPIRPAGTALGHIKPELARRFSLPAGIAVLCGIHDSSANFYRYQQAGFRDFALISTGTWIVAVSDRFVPDALAASGMTWNADVEGKPLTGVLAMGGREFATIAGDADEARADPAALRRLIDAGTLALPSFAGDDGLFAGSAGRGRIVGPTPETPEERRALALLYVALLTDACLDAIGGEGNAVLDGSFVKDPLFASLVAALSPQRRVLVGADAYGTAAGAALLADHDKRAAPAAVATESPVPLTLPGLDKVRRRWRDLARAPQSADPALREAQA